MSWLKGSIWKTGIKDRKVYVELWNYEDTQRLVDAELSPEQAYNIGRNLINLAIEQGYRVKR